MAFNINAQVILSGPKNIQKVRSSIQKQLTSINVPIKLSFDKNAVRNLGTFNRQLTILNRNLLKLKTNAKNAATSVNQLAAAAGKVNKATNAQVRAHNNVNKALGQSQKQINATSSAMRDFGKDAALAIRRFSAFTIATGVIFGFVRAVQTAVGQAFEFQRELVRLQQVMGRTRAQLSGITSTIDDLSVGLSISANKLLEVARIFAQTGQSVDEVQNSLRAVARASLAPTFGTIEKTTEGVIAALAQFDIQADKTEEVLGSLNAISKRFAVEADDLITVIRRAGGVFTAASGDIQKPQESLNELIAIFTAVRSTTRETADTIATGLRTIFSRIQRPQTLAFLDNFNIKLTDTEGRFIGFFAAFQKLSEGLESLSQKGDTITLGRIVEELGGVRQVGKLIPAIQQFSKAESARRVAMEGTASISKDVATATADLSVQILRTQQRFQEFVRNIQQSETFQNLARVALTTANAFVTLADALRPALPLLTTLAGIKITGALLEFSRGFFGGLRKGGGVGGAGGALGGAITGGPRGGGPAQQKLNAAIVDNTKVVNRNTQELFQLNQKIAGVLRVAGNLTAAAQNLNTRIASLIAILGRPGGGLGPAGRAGGPRRRRAGGGSVQRFAQGGIANYDKVGLVVNEFIKDGPIRGGFNVSGAEVARTIPFPGTKPLNSPNVFGTKAKAANIGQALVSAGGKNASKFLKNGRIAYKTSIEGIGTDEQTNFTRVFDEGIREAIQDSVNSFAKEAGLATAPKVNFDREFTDTAQVKALKGILFENTIEAFNGKPLKAFDGNKPFDFINGISPTLRQLYEESIGIQYLDAKLTKEAALKDKDILKKRTLKQLATDTVVPLGKLVKGQKGLFPKGQKKQGGGEPENEGISALLTPGELVFGPQAVNQIGVKNLEKFNRTGDSSLLGRFNVKDVGLVPGVGDGDSVSRVLVPGSFVVKKDVSEASGLQDDAQRMKHGGVVGKKQRFQRGGLVANGAFNLQSAANIGLVIAALNTLDVSTMDGFLNALLLTLVPLGNFVEGLRNSNKTMKLSINERRKLTKHQRIARINAQRRQRGDPSLRTSAALSRVGVGRDSPVSRFFGGAQGLLRGGAGIAALGVGAFSVEPIINSIAKKIGEVQVGDLTGFRGPHAREAAAGIGVARGVTQGALAGGAAGLALPFIGPLVGSIAGAVVGGITQGFKAVREQRLFESFDKLNTAAKALAVTLDKVGKVGINNIGSLDRLGRTSTSTINNILKETEKIASNLDFDDRGFFSRLAANALPTAPVSPEAAQAAQVKAAAEAFRLDVIRAGLGFSQAINKIDIEPIIKLRSDVSSELIEGLGLSALEEIIALDANSTFEDLSNVLIEANNNTELYQKQLEQLNKTQAAVAIAASKQLAETVGTSPIGQAANNAALEVTRAITQGKSLKEVKAIGETKLFKSLSSIGRGANLSNFVDSFDDLNDVIARAEAGNKSATKELNRLAQIANITPDTLSKVIKNFGLFQETLFTFGVAASKAQASQLLLTQAARDAVREIDAFAIALDALANRTSAAVSDLTKTTSNVQQEIDRQLSIQQTLAPRQRVNVFEAGGRGRSRDELELGVERVRGALGGDPAAFRDIASTIAVGNELPQALKETVDKLRLVEIEEGSFSFIELEKILIEQLGDAFTTATPAVQRQITTSLEKVFAGRGGRQAEDLGLKAIEKELSTFGDIVSRYSELSDQTAQAFETVTNNLGAFAAAVLTAANQQANINRVRTDAELEVIDKTNAFADRFDKFNEGSRPDKFIEASERIDERVGALARQGGGQFAGPIDASTLLERRTSLESQLQDRLTALGQDVGADGLDLDTVASALQRAQEIGNKKLVEELSTTASQLEGTNRALDLLRNDVSRLEAIESKLAAIQESRLTKRQRAQVALQRISQARSPQEQNRILAEFLQPVTAAAKAAQGIGLSRAEAAALQGDLLSGEKSLVKDVFGLRPEDQEKFARTLQEGIAVVFDEAISGLVQKGNIGKGLADVIGKAISTGAFRTSGEEEKFLKNQAKGILDEQVKIINEVTRQNTEAMVMQQASLTKQLDLTAVSALKAKDAFEQLRGQLNNIAPQANRGRPTPAGAMFGLGGGNKTVKAQEPIAPQANRGRPTPVGAMFGLGGGNKTVKAKEPNAQQFQLPFDTFKQAGENLGPVVGQLNQAADKLASLSTLQVELNARVAPVEVILNGAALVREFKASIQEEIFAQVVSTMEQQFVKNRVGDNPTLA